MLRICCVPPPAFLVEWAAKGPPCLRSGLAATDAPFRKNRPMPRILPLLLLCAAAHAAEVAQFRAEDFGTPWRAALGTDGNGILLT